MVDEIKKDAGVAPPGPPQIDIERDRGLVPIHGNPQAGAFDQIGVTGLKAFSGYVLEEYLPELIGQKSLKVYRTMGDDPIVTAVLTAISLILRAVDWRVEPADDGTDGSNFSKQAEAEAEFAQGLLDDMSHPWEDTIGEILSMLQYGWSYLEIVLKNRVGPDEDDAGKRSKFDDGRIGIRKLPIRSQDSLYRWDLQEDGGVNGMWQQPPQGGPQLFIPIERALLFRTTSRKNSPEGVSILRAAYRPWYIKRGVEDHEAIGIERDLAGLPVVSIPKKYLAPNATGADLAFKHAAEVLARDVKMNSQAGVVLPSETFQNPDGSWSSIPMMKLELLSSGSSKRTVDTDPVVKRYNRLIAMSALADFLTLGDEKGSYALSQNKSELFLRACESYLNQIAAVVNRFLFPRIFAYNGIAHELIPQIKPGRLAPVDLNELGAYISALASAGAPMFPNQELSNYLADVAGLPEPPEDIGLMTKPGQVPKFGQINPETGQPTTIDEHAEYQQADIGDTTFGEYSTPGKGGGGAKKFLISKFNPNHDQRGQFTFTTDEKGRLRNANDPGDLTDYRNRFQTSDGRWPRNPEIKTDQSTPLPPSFVHYTNGSDLAISTEKMRLFPHSISLGDPNADKSNFVDPEAGLSEYGQNKFDVQLRPGLKILKIDVNGQTKDFYNLGRDDADNLQRGSMWRDYAQAKGYDGIYATNIPGAGNELALFDLKNVASKKIVKFNQNHDDRGRFAMGTGDKELVRQWAEDGNWSDVQHAAGAVIGGMKRASYVCYDCQGDDGKRFDKAAHLIDAINSAPIVQQPLYRGITRGQYKVGDTFSESLTSWTTHRELAGDFASSEYSPRLKDSQPGQVFSLDVAKSVNSRGLNVSDNLPPTASSHLRGAGEYLTSGEYRVTKVDGQNVTVERIGPARKANLAKYNENHDELGRFTFGSGTKGLASELYKKSLEEGVKPEEIFNRVDPGAQSAATALEADLANRVPSDRLVSEGGYMQENGEYTPERAAIHQQMVDEEFTDEKVAGATPAPGEKPTMTMLGGRGGSGKSFLTDPSKGGPVDPAKTIILNSDNYKGPLARASGLDERYAALYHEESDHVLKMAAARAKAMGLNVAFDSTMKTESTAAARLQEFKDAGYVVNGHYVQTAPQEAAKRSISRFYQGGKASGRYVPPSVILSNTKNEANFDKLSPNFQQWSIWDNNGSRPTLVARYPSM